MPAPPNDNFAQAIVLTTQGPGGTFFGDNYVIGDNIGATVEAGEQPNYGKTVWYKWIAPDPTLFTTSNVWVMMTSFNRNCFIAGSNVPIAQTTDFDTILKVYQKGNAGLPWALSNLVEVASNDAANGWEKGSLVTMPAFSANDEFYIRIDGKKWDQQTQKFVGDQGHFVLSWKPLPKTRLMPCADCAPEFGPGWSCVGIVTPDIFAENFPSWGVQPKGSYLVKYCGGSWNYRDGYVVATVPQAATQTWPGNSFGCFCTFFAGSTQMNFPEPKPQGTGYSTPGAAEDAAGCMRISFELQASAECKLHFTDQKYDDNITSTVLPHYGLYRLKPVFAISSSSIIRNAGVGTTRYNAQIQILNLTQGTFGNIVFALQSSGGVANPTAPQPLSFGPSGSAGGIQTAFFNYDMLPMGKTDGRLTLKVSNPTYDPIPDLTLSLLPLVTTELLVAERVFRGGPVTLVYLNIGNQGLGPTYDLNAVITATGPGGAPVTIINDISGNPTNTFNLGQILGGSRGNGNLFFDLLTVSGAHLNIAWHDTLMDYAPASIQIPSV